MDERVGNSWSPAQGGWGTVVQDSLVLHVLPWGMVQLWSTRARCWTRLRLHIKFQNDFELKGWKRIIFSTDVVGKYLENFPLGIQRDCIFFFVPDTKDQNGQKENLECQNKPLLLSLVFHCSPPGPQAHAHSCTCPCVCVSKPHVHTSEKELLDSSK